MLRCTAGRKPRKGIARGGITQPLVPFPAWHAHGTTRGTASGLRSNARDIQQRRRRWLAGGRQRAWCNWGNSLWETRRMKCPQLCSIFTARVVCAIRFVLPSLRCPGRRCRGGRLEFAHVETWRAQVHSGRLPRQAARLLRPKGLRCLIRLGLCTLGEVAQGAHPIASAAVANARLVLGTVNRPRTSCRKHANLSPHVSSQCRFAASLSVVPASAIPYSNANAACLRRRRWPA